MTGLQFRSALRDHTGHRSRVIKAVPAPAIIVMALKTNQGSATIIILMYNSIGGDHTSYCHRPRMLRSVLLRALQDSPKIMLCSSNVDVSV